MNVRQMLYILSGLPYAGKSTLIKVLTRRLELSVISADQVMEAKGLDTANMNQEDWNTVYSETYEQLRNTLREGRSAILDMANLKRSERDTAREIAKTSGAESKLIFVNTPLEEIKRRWLENQTTQERGHLEDESMNLAIKMFEVPQEDENPILYNNEMNLDEWVNEHNIDSSEPNKFIRNEIKLV